MDNDVGILTPSKKTLPNIIIPTPLDTIIIPTIGCQSLQVDRIDMYINIYSIYINIPFGKSL